MYIYIYIYIYIHTYIHTYTHTYIHTYINYACKYTSYGDLFNVFFPKSVGTLGVLAVRVKAGCTFDVVSYVCAVFDDPYSTKVPSSPFSKEVSHETWSWRPFFRRCRFTSTPCSFFELCPFSLTKGSCTEGCTENL